jgi:branched-subunit amino acid permease
MAGRGRLHAIGAEQVLHANRHTRHLAERLAIGTVSGVSTMNAFRALAFATFALKAVATSTAVNSPEETPERMAATPSFVSSLILLFRHAELVSASIAQHDRS